MSRNTFDLVESIPVASLGIEFSEYRHRATGARHYHLASDDSNNAFMVAFPTLPEDSSGVAHILEHTTLCGSQRYPVRDPFFMMLRRSLNTYMNAFTSGDSTAYPFATQNRKDFDNLLGVYLDAVFFPRLHPLDFAQEGWRVEPENGGLAYHGVVYNEMKGAMSSELSQLWQHLHAALFPDTVYAHNSGGEPLAIPALTHDYLTAFHARHYHPSNAVFMTYGSFDPGAHQARFEELALARYDDRRDELVSPLQAPFDAPRASEVVYQCEEPERTTHIVWGWVLAEATDVEALIEAHLLSSLLLEHGASPLRHYLETTERANAPSELCGIDDSARQVVFMCGVEGSDPAHATALELGVLDVLEGVAKRGIEHAELLAAVDRIELAQRDLGGNGYPFGLQLMGRVLPAAMYRGEPRRLLDLDPVLERLRSRMAEPGYVAGLVRRLLLDNPHRARVVMRPDAAKAARDAAEEAARLGALQASLGADGVVALAEQAQALRARQAEVDDDSILPRVTLADVPPAQPLMAASAAQPGAVPLSAYACAANGVLRARIAYRLPRLTPAELAALPLFCDYVTELGHGSDDYLAVQTRRALTGSFSVYALVRPDVADAGTLHAWLVVNGKGLARKRDAILGTTAEIIEGARFDESERLRELLQQSRAEEVQGITDRGHRLAVLAAARSLSASAALDELWDGPSSIRRLEALAGDAAARETLAGHFAAIRDKLAGAPRELALIGDEDVLAAVDPVVPAPRAGGAAEPFVIDTQQAEAAQAWLINAQVNFCAKAYPACAEADADAAALNVLGRYLQDGFLHREIREHGGAYGSGAGYDADSQTFRFFSYRDPRLADTFGDFDRALEWFSGERDAQRLEEAILGAIRALDQPRPPAGEAERAFLARLCGRDDAFRQAYRADVLALTHARLAAAAERHLQPARGVRSALAGSAAADALAACGLSAARL